MDLGPRPSPFPAMNVPSSSLAPTIWCHGGALSDRSVFSFFQVNTPECLVQSPDEKKWGKNEEKKSQKLLMVGAMLATGGDGKLKKYTGAVIHVNYFASRDSVLII
jgi:hypothetical protein